MLVYAFDVPAGQKGKPDIDQAVAAVDRRLNPDGSWSKTAKVRRVSDAELEVRLRTDDPVALAKIDRLVRVLGSLEFRILANDHDNPGIVERAKALGPQMNKLYSSNGRLEAWWVPVDPRAKKDFTSGVYRDIVQRTVKTNEGEQLLQALALADRFNVTGSYLTYVAAGVDKRDRPEVLLGFNVVGAKKFAGLTSCNLPDEVTGFRRRVGIILDARLFSAPTITGMIHDYAAISGDFTGNEVQQIIAVLNAGALPAPLKKVSP